MPRQLRVFIPGSPHHIVSRANNKRRLFSSHSDYSWFLFDVEQSLAKVECRLHQLTLMDNHIHLIMTPATETDLPKFMKSCLQRYAQRRNRLREGTGKLWEQRYFCLPIEGDHQIAATTCYNDANAFRAGLLKVPEKHPWSTAGLHLGRPTLSEVPDRIWTPSPWYLELGRTRAQRAAKYETMFRAYCEEWRNRPKATSDWPAKWRRRRPVRPGGGDAR